jgi:hypothetical protein
MLPTWLQLVLILLVGMMTPVSVYSLYREFHHRKDD